VAAGGTPFASASHCDVLSFGALCVRFAYAWEPMPDYTPEQQGLVGSQGGGPANSSGCSNPYEVGLARFDKSQVSLSYNILAGRLTRIGLFSIAHGMWAVLGCLIGMVLSVSIDDGVAAGIAEVVGMLLIVFWAASIAMLVFGQLACLFAAVQAGEFKWISIALAVEALSFLLFYIRVWILVDGSLAEGLGLIQGMANVVALVAFLLHVRQVASSTSQHALVEEANKVVQLVIFALVMLECFNFVAVYFKPLLGMSSKLTAFFMLINLIVLVTAFCRYFKIIWGVASSIGRESNEQGRDDAESGEDQELSRRSGEVTS